ncbi:glycine-rich protein, partial [Conexibacter stalactiti]|nr:hypothetical protein [Conexibacter stalactiti]MEC5039501.1 glycine-rich protein [Conexibacter stalactiti]
MPRIRRSIAALAAVAATGAAAAPAVAAPVQQVFAYSGGVQPWTVPDGVTQATFMLQGAGGGIGTPGNPQVAGGFGAIVRATLPVSPGQVYAITVGGRGVSGPAGGFNGGGDAGAGAGAPTAGSGGGATDLRLSGAPLTGRLLVAAGGGGGGSTGDNSGIHGSGGIGGAAEADGSGGGAPGTGPLGGGGGFSLTGAGGTA